MKRLITAVLSIILFAGLFSWISYVPISQREFNVYYFGFLETFIFVIIYAGPIYFIAGIPLSIFIDKLIKKLNRKSKWGKYIAGLGLYSVFGILVGVILILFSQSWTMYFEVFYISLYGFIASIIYYHVLLLISTVSKI